MNNKTQLEKTKELFTEMNIPFEVKIPYKKNNKHYNKKNHYMFTFDGSYYAYFYFSKKGKCTGWFVAA